MVDGLSDVERTVEDRELRQLTVQWGTVCASFGALRGVGLWTNKRFDVERLHSGGGSRKD